MADGILEETRQRLVATLESALFVPSSPREQFGSRETRDNISTDRAGSRVEDLPSTR